MTSNWDCQARLSYLIGSKQIVYRMTDKISQFEHLEKKRNYDWVRVAQMD